MFILYILPPIVALLFVKYVFLIVISLVSLFLWLYNIPNMAVLFVICVFWIFMFPVLNITPPVVFDVDFELDNMELFIVRFPLLCIILP